MRNNYFLKTKGLLLGSSLLLGGALTAQIQVNQLTDFGSSIYDINNQGKGIHGGAYYDFTTNTSSAAETGVGQTVAINDANQVLGLFDNGSGDANPGWRDAGVWANYPATAFDPAVDYTIYDISENGKYVVGQTAWTPENGAWGFIYNNETQTFKLLSSTLYEYGAAYGVNNAGIAVGWVDDLPTGTVRMPAYFTEDGSITLIQSTYGEANAINENNEIVGVFGGVPFIYKMATSEFTTYAIPADFETGAFSDISEDGIAVGFTQKFIPGQGGYREPILYKADFDANPVLIKTILNDNGVTYDEASFSGIGYRISADGKYLAGWISGPAFMATGWAIYFNDFFNQEGPCADKTIMECGVTYTAELVPNAGEWTNYPDVTYDYTGSEKVFQYTAPVAGTYTFNVDQGTGDADFFVMDSCGNTGDNLTDWYWTGEQAQTIDLTAGQTVYVIADLYSSVTAPTTVSISVDCPDIDGCLWTVNVSDDYFGDEVTWELRDDAGTVILSGGPYTGNPYSDEQTVTANGPLEFFISTVGSFGDNTPSYSVSNENGVILSGVATGGETATFSDLNCDDVPPPSYTCADNAVASNNMENGSFFGGSDNQRLAADIITDAAGFTAYGVELNVFVDGNTDLNFDFTFYEDAAGVPGTEVASKAGQISTMELVGNAFGYDVYRYKVAFDTPMAFDGNKTYWMEVTSDGLAWETTSATTFGSTMAFANTGTSDAWTIGTSELVYSLVCEELGVGDMSSFDFAYYPNPVKDVLNITAQKAVKSVEAYNLAGQKVMSSAKVNNGQINVNALTPGTYVFKVTLEGGQVETFKIIKK